MNTEQLKEKTIRDFGQQWVEFPDNNGYYASQALLRDLLAPLIDTEALKGKHVAEIGSGTGRIVNMLIGAGIGSVLAVEPSDAFEVLTRNTAANRDRCRLLRVTGDLLPPTGDLDCVFSIGVLHHIPDPAPVVLAAYSALRSGGKFFAWVYAREGNRAILTFLLPLRKITQRLPHKVLNSLVWFLDIPVRMYMGACRYLPLPLGRYLNEVLGKFDTKARRLVLYDQLNPAYAKYYSQAEAKSLLASAGFSEIRLHHRHGYSWSVIGTKK